jgi:N-acyl homoserine lactone hydrolase
MSEVRLYTFQCGTLSCWQQWIKFNEPSDERFVMPVPFYVITHPKGAAIVDGGNAPEVAVDHVAHWGPEATGEPGLTAHMKPEEACVPQLRAHGFDPKDFKYIIQTHLHLDHDGALAVYDEFGDASVVVTRREWEYARTPEWHHQYDYIKADIDRPHARLELLERSDDGYDLYGDGTVKLWMTPGHTDGHMSVEVKLPETGSVLLTSDAAYTVDHWQERSLPGSLSSTIDAVRSVRKLHRIANREGSLVIFGHDPDQWPTIKQAPEYYG